MKRKLLTLSILVVLYQFGKAQKADTLYITIMKLDSILFEEGLNKKNIAPIEKLFDSSLEFYHDKSGITNYAQNIAIFKENFTKPEWNVSRKLLKSSMEVYPIPNFGALQVGQHEFCNVEQGKKGCQILKFSHLWKQTNNEWTITRILSYDH